MYNCVCVCVCVRARARCYIYIYIMYIYIYVYIYISVIGVWTTMTNKIIRETSAQILKSPLHSDFKQSIKSPLHGVLKSQCARALTFKNLFFIF